MIPGHIFREFLPEAAQFDQHREYFPVVNGERKVNGTGACFSNARWRTWSRRSRTAWARMASPARS